MMSALMPTYKRLPVAFTRGEGALLWDQQGRQYIDGLSGIAVTNLGHCHPAITAAINEQASSLIHTSNLFQIPAQERLAAELTGATGMDATFFCNSGAEANEAAIKLARLHGHNSGIEQPIIIVAEQSFHGRTMGTLSATGNRKVQAGFEPLLGGFARVPFGDVAAVELVAKNNKGIVAILIEPIQGEGGIQIPDTHYLSKLRTICDS
ncbi:MAG: aminotransferase class III-fold pyridoxal phosphate-dependent enzyme, partial [Cellvibrionales bacterium]|nr:aminotransferase class III-fold pyridoxal phosphate-dependent enzyme [Cellvibrionales bacterium]